MSIGDTIEERQFGWFGQVVTMQIGRRANRVYEANSAGRRDRGRPRCIWEDEINNRIR